MINVDFKSLRWDAGFIDKKACAMFLGVTVKSVTNWDKQYQAPKAVVMILHVVCNGFDYLGDEWSGWVFRDGRLQSRANRKEFIFPGEIRALPYLYISAGLSRSELVCGLDKQGLLYSVSAEAKKRQLFPDLYRADDRPIPDNVISFLKQA